MLQINDHVYVKGKYTDLNLKRGLKKRYGNLTRYIEQYQCHKCILEQIVITIEET
jgi:hypothetical protein